MEYLLYLALVYVLWLIEILYLHADAITTGVAVLVLGVHPPHEHFAGFRDAVNRWVDRLVPSAGRFHPAKIQPGRAFAQMVGLALAGPAIVLWGPIWALPGIQAFYVADRVWTHGFHAIPGRWTATAGAILCTALILVRGPELVAWLAVHPPARLGLLLLIQAAGIAALSVFWWRIRREVGTP